MKTNRTRWLALSAALLMAIPFIARSQTTNVPAAINYQGHLTDTLGHPLPGGYYEIDFRIWDSAVSSDPGDLLWSRTLPLHVVTNGLFNVLLTDDPANPTNSLLGAFNGPNRYLGLTITESNGVPVSGPEVNPRQQLASAPFAITAQTANEVGKNGVSAASLQDGSVTTETIAPGNVTSASLADQAVTTAKMADQAVTTAQLATNAVTTAKIANQAVTTAKIADGAVTTAQIPNGAVTTAKIANGGVSTAQIADGAVTTAKIAAGAVTPGKLSFAVAALNTNQTFTGANTFTNTTTSFIGAASPLLYVDNKGGANQLAKFEMSGANLIIRSATAVGGGKAAVIEDTGPNALLALNPNGGHVDIGTTETNNALVQINGSSDYIYSKYGQLNSKGTTGAVYNDGGPYSLYCKNRIAASEFDAFSDARIKHIIGRSDSWQDLKTLLGLQIADYTMVDTHQYGHRRFKKVIAQQVEQVYPQAVSTNLTRVVPDIYVRAQARAGWIPLPKRLKPALRPGDQVRLILANGARLYAVKAANARGFRVSASVNGPVFVYGRLVHDFHVVDYDALTTLNISATQELYHRLVQSEKPVARLKAQDQDLRAGVAWLKAYDRKQQAQFAALEKRVEESPGGGLQASLH